jgi:hypothetical protein
MVKERCLKYVDSGMRKMVGDDSECKGWPGPKVFTLLYSRVVDRLGAMQGIYQNKIISQNR